MNLRKVAKDEPIAKGDDLVVLEPSPVVGFNAVSYRVKGVTILAAVEVVHTISSAVLNRYHDTGQWFNPIGGSPVDVFKVIP